MSHITTFFLLQKRREEKKRENIIRWLKNLKNPYPLIPRVLGYNHIPSYLREWEQRFFRNREEFYFHLDEKHKKILEEWWKHDIRA